MSLSNNKLKSNNYLMHQVTLYLIVLKIIGNQTSINLRATSILASPPFSKSYENL